MALKFMMTGLVIIASWLSEFFSSFGQQFLDRLKPGDIGEEINEAIMQVQMYFTLGDYKLLITDAVIVTWIAVIAVVIVVRCMVGKPTLKLNKRQTLLVSLVELIITTGMSFGMKRKEAETVAPMIMTFGLVITACNAISFLKVPPPAKNVAFPIGCAITAIIYVIVMTFKFVGAKGFWLTLTQPISIMLPFKLLDYVVKPLSLALRLFGNVFAAFVFMEFISICIPCILPGVLGLWFDIMDGIIQAIVFAYLTMSYIGENVETVHEYNEHPEDHQKKKKSKKSKKSEAVAA
jgi:F-type H+-transporting ATPase subunit a